MDNILDRMENVTSTHPRTSSTSVKCAHACKCSQDVLKSFEIKLTYPRFCPRHKSSVLSFALILVLELL